MFQFIIGSFRDFKKFLSCALWAPWVPNLVWFYLTLCISLFKFLFCSISYNFFLALIFCIYYFNFCYTIVSILLPVLKFHANIPRGSGVFDHEEWQKYTFPLRKGNWTTMNMVLDTKKCNSGSREWLWFHICFIMTLYYKMRQILLQNEKTILLGNGTRVYYKMHKIF